jgi:alcohol dehydrogenase class IV
MAQTQTALAHALSYAQTAANKKSHGQSCAYWLPYVWQLLIQSNCDPDVLASVKKAVGKYFRDPTEMEQWLLTLGFSVYPPLERDKKLEEQVSIVKLSTRGRNFLGFDIND